MADRDIDHRFVMRGRHDDDDEIRFGPRNRGFGVGKPVRVVEAK